MFISVQRVHISSLLFLPFIYGYQKAKKCQECRMALQLHSEQSTTTAVWPICLQAENRTPRGTMPGIADQHGATSRSRWEPALLPWAVCVHNIVLIILL